MGDFGESIHFCKYSLEIYRLFDDKTDRKDLQKNGKLNSAAM
ncbi:unnamed protein product [marine sediment metagenome]|uniref:Uncharacterized protein n=1 Tax=marine sediment metagenome TaxID=412755 RepID=X0ZY82_9ZZZZ